MSRYIVISPVKNEEDYIEKTIESMRNQTLQPLKWIIVNDGSTDKTKEIIEKHMIDYDRIVLINRTKAQGTRKRGKGVVEAFNEGLEKIKGEGFEFVVKLDGDLILPQDFFETIMDRFEKDPKLGLAGGAEHTLIGEEWVKTRGAKGSTYGTAKVYRTECFNDIGGLVPSMGWDGIDQIMAVMKGWKTCCFEDVVYHHLRAIGKGTGMVKAAYEEGVCCYFMGYHPLFFILRALKMAIYSPFVVGSVAMLIGFLKCRIYNEKRIDNPSFISFLRKNQIRRLLRRSNEYINQV